MALTTSGTLYVANAHNTDSLILAFGPPAADGTRQYTSTYATQSTTGLAHPYGLAVDPTGDVLASSQDTCVVSRFVAGNGSTLVSQSVHATSSNCPTSMPQVDHGLEGPRGVALDGSGNLYVADNVAGKVRVYALATGAWVKDLAPSGGNPAPVGLYVSGSTLYVSSEGTDRVDAIDLSTGQATPLPHLSFEAPSGLTCGPDGALYVNDRKAEKTYRYDLTTQSASTFVDYKEQNIDDEPEQLLAVAASPPTCASASSPSPSK
jgi:serine/threonine-protein kinase